MTLSPAQQPPSEGAEPTAAVEDRSERCLVVGAGPAGLAQARAFKRAGIAFDLIERHRDLGGIWDIDNPGTPMYRSARFISSKRRSAFLGFPMPAAYPDYPGHGQILPYLKHFAEAEGLADDIAFETRAEWIEPRDDGLWSVRLNRGPPRLYRGVVCANGMTWRPQAPEIPGRFEGELHHAVSYRDPAAFRGRRVLVIGGGNTGCDIACDLTRQAAATRLSLRRGYHVVPRHILGLPADVFGAALPGLPLRLQQGSSQGLLRLLQGKRRGWPAPDHRLYESHPIINSEILDLVERGAIRVKPDVEAFEGREVRFADGSCAAFDAVLLATGYKMAIPFMDPVHFAWEQDRIAGFLTAFNARHRALFTLGFLAINAGVFGDFDRLAHLIACHLRDQEENPLRAEAFRRIVATETPDLTGGLALVPSPRHAVYAHHPAFRAYLEKLRRRMGWPPFPG
ncbi:MAG: NAD(P)/FAD-dependent oxidoreductase [Kiloniellales bacterium]|nr:NAD(P)/FAD-dependent oxidoreductase [Kiloniellales bacterium]